MERDDHSQDNDNPEPTTISTTTSAAPCLAQLEVLCRYTCTKSDAFVLPDRDQQDNNSNTHGTAPTTGAAGLELESPPSAEESTQDTMTTETKTTQTQTKHHYVCITFVGRLFGSPSSAGTSTTSLEWKIANVRHLN
jgi:hypothetical protein